MKAIYHQDRTTRITLDVLETKDGKATLGREKEVLVSGVVISQDGAPGTCTLGEGTAKKGKGRKAAKDADAKDDESDADANAGDITDVDEKLDA